MKYSMMPALQKYVDLPLSEKTKHVPIVSWYSPIC